MHISLKRVAFVAAIALMAGCARGSSGVMPGAQTMPQMASVQFQIAIPAATQAQALKPAYVSASTKSAAVVVSPGSTTTIINCTTLTCSGTVLAPIGSDTFTVNLYDGTNGTGNLLSTGSLTQTIGYQNNTVSVTFNGVVASLVVSLSPTSVTVGTSATVGLTVNALDSDGNTIIAPGVYVNASGSALTINLSDSDSLGTTKLSQTSRTQPTSNLNLSYSGACIANPTITASATGLTSKQATLTVNAAGPIVTPLTIDATQTDLPSGTPVYAYIIGNVSGTYYRIDACGTVYQLDATKDNTQAAGTFPGSSSLTPAAVSAIAPNYPSAWADYSIPISQTSPTQISLANIKTIPGLGTGTAAFSGRIFISVGVPKLPITAQPGGWTAPVFTTPPGYLTLFDWIEFSYDANGNFNGNTTQVDQFGFPLFLNGTPGGTQQGQYTASRATIMSAIVNAASPFGGGSFQVAVPSPAASAYPSGVNLLRVLSPKTLNGQSSQPFSTYFDAAIKAAYATWQTTPLVTHEQSTGAYYTGFVPTSGSNNGVLVFVSGNHPTLSDAASQPVAFTLPLAGGVIPTNDVWQNANTLAAGSKDQKNVEKQIAAMFNRGLLSTLLDDAACPSASTFYPTGSTYNVWAFTFHHYSTNGLAYGFPYDDVCMQNPSISLTGATSVTITLGNFFK